MISGLVRATPRSSNLAFMASSFSSMVKQAAKLKIAARIQTLRTVYFRSFMAYRKLRAERLFDGYRFREDAVLVVEGSGLIRDILTAAQAGEEVEKFPGILMPGMVNCHCHL